MLGRKICRTCKTGRASYELDSHSPVCPYMSSCSGRKCAFYAKDESMTFIHRLKESVNNHKKSVSDI